MQQQLKQPKDESQIILDMFQAVISRLEQVMKDIQNEKTNKAMLGLGMLYQYIVTEEKNIKD